MILNSWLLCLLLYKSQYKNSLYNLVTELSHPPEVQALGKSSRYTDIVLIDFTSAYFGRCRTFQNGPSQSSLAMCMALWSKWDSPGECPWQSDVANALLLAFVHPYNGRKFFLFGS